MRTRSSAWRSASADRPAPSAPSSRGQPLTVLAAQAVQRHGSGVGGQAQDPVPVFPYAAQARRPAVETGVRHGEDRTHGHSNGPSVERIGTARAEQDGVHAERGGAAEHGADVGGIVHILEDQYSPGRSQQDRSRLLGTALHRGQHAAVDVEAGQRLEHVGTAEEDRRATGQRGELAIAIQEQQRAEDVPSLHRPPNNHFALGNEQPIRRFQAAA